MLNGAAGAEEVGKRGAEVKIEVEGMDTWNGVMDL